MVTDEVYTNNNSFKDKMFVSPAKGSRHEFRTNVSVFFGQIQKQKYIIQISDTSITVRDLDDTWIMNLSTDIQSKKDEQVLIERISISVSSIPINNNCNNNELLKLWHLIGKENKCYMLVISYIVIYQHQLLITSLIEQGSGSDKRVTSDTIHSLPVHLFLQFNSLLNTWSN